MVTHLPAVALAAGGGHRGDRAPRALKALAATALIDLGPPLAAGRR